MATDFKSIPIIDISPLLAKSDDPKMAEDPGVNDVVKQLDQACREAGFFYVKGHGIPDSLLKEVKELTRKFFTLPYEEKTKIKMSPAKGYRGYQRIGENITKGIPDIHEAIDCYKELKPGDYGDLGKTMEGCNQWPLDPPKFMDTMEDYINQCTNLSRKIMRGIALALGGSPYEFEGDRAGNAFWVTRIIGYPGKPCENGHEKPTNDVGWYRTNSILVLPLYFITGYIVIDLLSFLFVSSLSNKSSGPHTDYGLLTLVNQDDDITALQVRNLSGEWISAPPIPGAFVCNIGDMLKIYSNGLYESTLHQVINNSTKFRVSVAYFYETNFDTAVEPLDICKQKTGSAKKFERAVYGEHLVSKVVTNFV